MLILWGCCQHKFFIHIKYKTLKDVLSAIKGTIVCVGVSWGWGIGLKTGVRPRIGNNNGYKYRYMTTLQIYENKETLRFDGYNFTNEIHHEIIFNFGYSQFTNTIHTPYRNISALLNISFEVRLCWKFFASLGGPLKGRPLEGTLNWGSYAWMRHT